MSPPPPPSLPRDRTCLLGPTLTKRDTQFSPPTSTQSSVIFRTVRGARNGRCAGKEAEEEGNGILARPASRHAARQPASKSSTASSRDWLYQLGFWRPRQPSKTCRGWPISGRSGTRSLHSRRKSLQQLSSGPFVPSPSSLSLSLPLSPSRECHVPLCGVPQAPSPSDRFAVVLRSRGEELIGFVVTSRSCQELTSALVTDEDITVTGSETAQLVSQGH